MDVQGGRVSIPARPGRATTVQASLVTRLRALPGVRGLALVHRRPDAGEYGWNRGVVSCADLAGTPALGTCPAGARSEVVDLIFDGGRRFDHGNEPSPLDVASLPVTALVLDAQGAPATVERARTLLQRAYPLAAYPSTIAEEEANYPDTQRLAQYRQLADVVILASLPIAGCSLAVTVAAGLSERRRPFGLLRLAGTPLPVLRRVVALESAVPMLAVAAVAVGVSFLASAMFLRSQLGETLQPPSGGYYAAVAGGVLASVAIIASTLPLLSRLTGPENVRND
jgi:hypothetical protein